MKRAAKSTNWLDTVPDCLAGDVCDAADLEEAVALATTQLDLIHEGQDGTEHYTRRDVRAIEKWIKNNGSAV